MKIDQEEFNRKAQHILDTVVKPQVEKYEKAKAKGTLKNKGSIYLNKEHRKEEVAGISTMLLLIGIIICIIGATIQAIFNLI
jgi:p-aminobenzoyl-glutamate transporter AbgT